MSNPHEKLPPAPDRKDEILAVAAKEFASKGYAAVSMRVLAEKAKITPAALYHHYSGKDAIYLAVLNSVFADKAADLVENLEGAGSPEDKLDRAIFWLVRLFFNDDGFKRLLQRELLDADEARLKSLAQNVVDTPFHAIENLLGQLDPRADTRLSTTTVFALVLGLIQLAPILKGTSLMVSASQENSEAAILPFVKYIKSIVLCGINVEQESKTS